jgi:hypothetical protein
MPDLGFPPGRKESQPPESKKIKSAAHIETILDILSIRYIAISFKVMLGAASGALFILRPTKPSPTNPGPDQPQLPYLQCVTNPQTVIPNLQFWRGEDLLFAPGRAVTNSYPLSRAIHTARAKREKVAKLGSKRPSMLPVNFTASSHRR